MKLNNFYAAAKNLLSTVPKVDKDAGLNGQSLHLGSFWYSAKINENRVKVLVYFLNE
jgi:hypothetical protein